MTPDWPDQVVADTLAALFSNERATLWKDYGSGTVVVRAGDHEANLSPSQAERLADGYEDSLEDEDRMGDLQTEEAVERLRTYADEVRPYHDDAAAE